MRVLFISRKWAPAVGGMETYSMELVRAMSVMDDIEIEPYVLRGQADGKPPRPLDLARFIARTACLLPFCARRFDVIHFGDFVLAPLVPFARLGNRRVRTAISLHGLDIFYGRRKGFLPGIYRRVIVLMRHVLKAAGTRIIANSSATREAAAAIGIESLEVPLGTTERQAPANAGGPNRRILYTGRIIPRKGPAWFADNVLPLLDEDIVLDIAGPETDREETEKLKANPRVRLLGCLFGGALDQARREALCVVMPNRRSENEGDIEGFGLIAPEASMVGGVVLASGIEGIVSAIRDEQTGFLLNPDKPGDWADRIRRIAGWSANERHAFTSAAADATRHHYSWRRVAAETLNIYRASDREIEEALARHRKMDSSTGKASAGFR